MTRDHPGPSGFAGDPFYQPRLPLDVKPDALREGLEPPAPGQHEDPAGRELKDLPQQEPRSIAALQLELWV